MKEVWKTVVGGILIGMFGTTVGFTVSQVEVSSSVRLNSAELLNLKSADISIRNDIIAMRAENAGHMRDVIELFKENMKVNQEFINLLKVQNELLRKDIK